MSTEDLRKDLGCEINGILYDLQNVSDFNTWKRDTPISTYSSTLNKSVLAGSMTGMMIVAAFLACVLSLNSILPYTLLIPTQPIIIFLMINRMCIIHVLLHHKIVYLFTRRDALILSRFIDSNLIESQLSNADIEHGIRKEKESTQLVFDLMANCTDTRYTLLGSFLKNFKYLAYDQQYQYLLGMDQLHLRATDGIVIDTLCKSISSLNDVNSICNLHVFTENNIEIPKKIYSHLTQLSDNSSFVQNHLMYNLRLAKGVDEERAIKVILSLYAVEKDPIFLDILFFWIFRFSEKLSTSFRANILGQYKYYFQERFLQKFHADFDHWYDHRVFFLCEEKFDIWIETASVLTASQVESILANQRIEMLVPSGKLATFIRATKEKIPPSIFEKFVQSVYPDQYFQFYDLLLDLNEPDAQSTTIYNSRVNKNRTRSTKLYYNNITVDCKLVNGFQAVPQDLLNYCISQPNHIVEDSGTNRPYWFTVLFV
ncbi:hypothetical protein PPL_09168 [Heterostelium album PN500]|uniref:Uncharacterized protein n=1 Tax=Heterostelium pallidum (strain ATCC 26659 / Pp 5 / PN500) TaxID=670386 RepID=D3BKT6_HETP5|nr:hypothetical protein PPL_09168 [Heterostelium album PN500]EFA78516.1 hypothetical protein PPL_09168 [Heterostelium album PN500]|eukprot:XP_020430640.1 hypothetical protein PPL_09168 [Heterostelium album PN500]